MTADESLKAYNLLRITALEDRIDELDRTNLLYAIMLYNIDSLPIDDDLYSTVKEMGETIKEKLAIKKENVRKDYINSLDAMDYEAGDPE